VENLRRALRRWRLEVRRLGLQALLVGTGLWLVGALCLEHLVADLAAALERRPDRHAWPWARRLVERVWTGLARWLRRRQPALRAFRERAARRDAALLRQVREDHA
jgi:hypothetical protein